MKLAFTGNMSINYIVITFRHLNKILKGFTSCQHSARTNH